MRSWNLPKIRIYYCLIIINAYYKYIINAQYNYYNSNKVLLEECDKEVSVPVTGGCYCFLFEKKTVKRSVQCHACAQSLPGRRPSDKYPVNIYCSLTNKCNFMKLGKV